MYFTYLKNQTKSRATTIKHNLTKEKIVFVTVYAAVALSGAAYTKHVIDK